MINNPTHVSDTYSSCIDLIFASQPSLVVESRRSPILTFKLCGNSICKPLEIIYKECFSLNLFPLAWKKGNSVPVHKKGDKLCLKNCWPVLLLPVCEKILEKIIFDQMLQFFIKNKTVCFKASRLLYQPVITYKDMFINMRQLLAILWTFESLLHFDQLFFSDLQNGG